MFVTPVIALAKPIELLTDNGWVLSPIIEANAIEANAGDTICLTLSSQLDTPTNLHYHGLHNSPEIDDVFREVAPGDRYTYEFQIPPNHLSPKLVQLFQN